MTFPLLTLLGLVPLVGALVTFALKGAAAKYAGIAFSLVTLAMGVWAFALSASGTGFDERYTWIRAIGAHWSLGSDTLSMTMVLLTVIVVPIVLLAEWTIGDDPESGRGSTGAFFALALMLESFALYCFMATDTLLFYLFFEATLIPMYFLIGRWGGPKRGQAALKFLLYSLAGGLVMLFSVVGVGAEAAKTGQASFLVSDLAAANIDQGTWGRLLFLGFFIAFAIKAPMVPVHTWLPDTAEQASPGSSTLLVGILDKIGTFGMLRFCLAIFPDSSKWATPVILVLAVVSVIYGALMAIGSRDLLRLVSYTSISHFGIMVLGIFAFTSTSIQGSIFYMLNHGFSTAALFLVIGFLVKRRGSAQISAFGGVQKTAPVLAGLFLVAGLSALSLPGTSSFISEYMVLAGSWQRQPIFTAIAVLGMVLSALYILLAYQRTMTGPVTEQTETHVSVDLNLRERAVLVPLVALLLVFGFYPKPLVTPLEQPAKEAMSHVDMTDPETVVKGGN
ncbi:NADH-quinone oxidoreductase subunit M [Aestuariimicrobium ganziense]|uniref:NADH-quinone oxidoreductase subunit M n=1 Tax=Aestuariimicrobium ganziense TaxID=2773677 RepID=UPI001945B6E8|nr:NADH-quinone oxidoreductase subunit M [Aestuariimicrobium ganziense]